jgi:hypothetical protein
MISAAFITHDFFAFIIQFVPMAIMKIPPTIYSNSIPCILVVIKNNMNDFIKMLMFIELMQNVEPHEISD